MEVRQLRKQMDKEKQKKLNKLKELASILDAKKDGTESLVLLRKINELKDELDKLQPPDYSSTFSDIDARLNKLLKDVSSVSKDADFSVNYFKEELHTIKNTISDLKLKKGENGKDGTNGRDGKDADPVDTSKLALEASKRAVAELKPLIKEISPPETGEAIIGKINDDETTLIKKEKVEGLEELERKADFALQRPLTMGGGGEVLKIKGGQNIRVDQVGGVNTISVTGSLGASSFTDLDDTFTSYTGLAGKGLRVNGTETGIDTYTPTDTDEKVKYDAGDTTAGYLSDKIIAGDNITITEGSGADENKVKIAGLGGDFKKDGSVQMTGTFQTVAGTLTIAPIKMTAGVNLTTPEAGVIEFDGSDYYVTI